MIFLETVIRQPSFYTLSLSGGSYRGSVLQKWAGSLFPRGPLLSFSWKTLLICHVPHCFLLFGCQGPISAWSSYINGFPLRSEETPIWSLSVILWNPASSRLHSSLCDPLAMDSQTTSGTQRDRTDKGFNALVGGWRGTEKRNVGDTGRADA